jgi:hypothetical protein
MAMKLPLRIRARLHAGFERTRIIVRTVRRHGERRRVRHRVTVLRPSAGVRFGRRAPIAGRLVNSDGDGIVDAQLQVVSRADGQAEQLVATLETDTNGRFHYATTGSSSRIIELVYAGSPHVLPAQRHLRMRVPAATSARVRPQQVLNGQAVTFVGRVRGRPVPASGKLVELQVRVSGRWQTFRTTRSDAAGRWTSRYRFRRTRGVVWYRFRVQLPREAGYPFEIGTSRALMVRVRGE